MLVIISICELQFDNRAQRRYINTADCPFSQGVPADGGRVQLCGSPRCKEERKTEEGTIKLFILGPCSSTAPSLFPLFLFPVLLSLSQQSRTLNHTPTEGVGGRGTVPKVPHTQKNNKQCVVHILHVNAALD